MLPEMMWFGWEILVEVYEKIFFAITS